MKPLALLLLGAAIACAAPGTTTRPAPVPTVSARARQLYDSIVVIDTHNDLPTKMLDEGYVADERHAPGRGPDQGETDLPRLSESGIDGQFLSAWVDARYAEKRVDLSWERVNAYIDTIHAFVDRHPDRLAFATSARDILEARRQHKVAILIGVEGGHAIENSLEHLRELYARGVRYMTLTWNNGNDWAGSSVGVDGTRTGGLTPFGRDVVREMNRLGMLVDVSHVSDSTFFDAVAVSTAPVIASHSSAHALDAHPRNLSDEQLRAVARNGGVVNVNFYSVFLDPRFLDVPDSARANLSPPPLSILIDHIDHVARVAGIDHVGIGSDFDGVGGLLPQGMEDVTHLPVIVQALIDRGYSDADISKIMGGNMLRVMRQVLDRQ